MNHHQEHKGKYWGGGSCPYIKYQLITFITIIISDLPSYLLVSTAYSWPYHDSLPLNLQRLESIPLFKKISFSLSSFLQMYHFP